MQQPNGQFMYLNNGANLQGQNVVTMAPGQQQRQQYVVVVPAPVQNAVIQPYANYRRSASRAMGALQITMGILLIGLNIGLAVISYNYAWVVASGWWAAPFYILAGSFGIAAGGGPSSCSVITTMVLSIFSTVTVICVVAQGALSMALDCEFYDYHYGWCYKDETANYAVASIFIVVGLCEFAFALVQSILCCQACCNKPPVQQTTQGAVQQAYSNGGFVPCYIHSQAPMQAAQMQPMQTATNQPEGGAWVQNIAMATGQTGGATGGATPVQPPAYSVYTKEQEANT